MDFNKLYNKIKFLDEGGAVDSAGQLITTIKNVAKDNPAFVNELEKLLLGMKPVQQGNKPTTPATNTTTTNNTTSDTKTPPLYHDSPYPGLFGGAANALKDRAYEIEKAVNGIPESYDDEEETLEDCSMGECGGETGPSMQPNNTTMNLNMSGSGKDGIRDLLNILKNIESQPKQDPHTLLGNSNTTFVDNYENDLDNKQLGIKSVIPSGNDLHKSKSAYPATAGGNNPLARRLNELYHQIKNQ